MKKTSYTIHCGTVRNAPALYHHVMPIAARASRANEALGKATRGLIEAEKHAAGVEELVVKYGSDGLYGKALTYARRVHVPAAGQEARGIGQRSHAAIASSHGLHFRG